MKLGELEFKPEDFKSCAANLTHAKTQADHANRLLAERLERATRVFGFLHADGYILLDTHAEGSETHTARIVCIEEN